MAAHDHSDHFHRYLPISASDRRWGLYVLCGGYLRVPKGTPYPLPGHPRRYSLLWQSGRVLDEYQLHFITRGSGSFESGRDRPRSIVPGSAFLLYPGLWHRYQPDPSTGWDEFWLGFNGETAQRIMAPPFFDRRQPLVAVSERSALLEQFTGLIAAMRGDGLNMQRLLAGHAQMMLSILQMHIADGQAGVRGTQFVQQAKARIATTITTPFVGKALAQELGVGDHPLRRIFRQQTGFSLHDYHLQLRMHAAMSGLESSDEPVVAIARSVGFEDAFYFSRMFKRHTGMAPQRWRRQRRGVA